MKIIPLNNTHTPDGRAEIILKYSLNKRFWSDFPDNRPHNLNDNLIFLLPVYDKLNSMPQDLEKETKILIYLKAMWDRTAKELGIKSTPRAIVMHIMNFFMFRIYKRKVFKRHWIKIMNILYESYFTSSRIKSYYKFRVLK